MPTKVGTYQSTVDSTHAGTPVPTEVGTCQSRGTAVVVGAVDSTHPGTPVPTKVGTYQGGASIGRGELQAGPDAVMV